MGGGGSASGFSLPRFDGLFRGGDPPRRADGRMAWSLPVVPGILGKCRPPPVFTSAASVDLGTTPRQ